MRARRNTVPPRPTSTFVGRDGEIARIVALAENDVLFLIYGVPGIGKSELALRALETLRGRPAWTDAEQVVVEVRPGMDANHVAAVLRHRFSSSPSERRPAGVKAPRLGPASSIEDELDPVLRALNSSRQLLLLEDLHLLRVDEAARLLGHLARHVRASRVFVTSRLELPLPSGAPVPVVTRLEPLDDSAGRRMVSMLAERLGIDRPDVAGILRRAGGSPFFIQRAVAAGGRVGSAAAGDPLDAVLGELSAPEWRALLRASVVTARVSVDDLTGGAPRAAAPLAALAGRFLVDLTDGMVAVHDLVRDAVLRRAAVTERTSAHREAAKIHAARHHQDPARHALDAVEAVAHMCAAGDHIPALDLIEKRHHEIAAAGVDHLLLGALQQIRAAAALAKKDSRAGSIDLLIARILVRRSCISEAQEVLARLADDPKIGTSVRYLTLAGMVAEQQGDLPTAEACFRRAQAVAGDERRRARLALHLADVLSLRGETDRAREVLAEVRPICAAMSRRALHRWTWSLAVSLVHEQSFVEAAQVAGRARKQAMEDGAVDLAAQLALLEALARAEVDDAAGSRALVDGLFTPAARAGALRAQVATFYAGVAAWAEGDLRAARVALDETYEYLTRHRDLLLGGIVGHYLGRTLLTLGEVAAATEIIADTTRRAEEVGLGVAPVGQAMLARAHVAAGHASEGRALATRVLALPNLRAYARQLAERALALALAQEGDHAAARARIAAVIDAFPAVEQALRMDATLDRAEIEMLGGDPAIVIECARTARAHYAGRGRRYHEARACAALAAGYIGRGDEAGRVLAEEALVRAESLEAQLGYDHLGLRLRLCRAALAVVGGDREGAERILTSALASSAARGRTVSALLLEAAVDQVSPRGGAARHLPAGLAAMLGFLGLRSHDLSVDLTAATITSRHAPGQAVKGRPVACLLLAVLVDTRDPMSAETLYCRVWGAKEYHPLRHRNALYVALNRLRQTLADLLPGREVIETLPSGWRLAAGVDVEVRGARKTM